MRKSTVWTSKYFCGNEISAYGLENGYVDYATLAKSFDAVLNNDIIGATCYDEWEQISGFIDNSDEIDELNEQIEELKDLITENSTTEEDSDTIDKINELESRIEELENEENNLPEVFQWFIISEQGAEILQDYTNEMIMYNDNLNMYVWGVTHWGTSWDYVLTDIKIDLGEQATA